MLQGLKAEPQQLTDFDFTRIELGRHDSTVVREQ
jgi:hypothetical protein